MNKFFLLIGIFFSISLASYRTGAIDIFMFGDTLDFSEITDSCQKRPSNGGYNSCAVIAMDMRLFLNGNQFILLSTKGIKDLGQNNDINCIDTIAAVPTEGFSDTAVLARPHLYVIRTSEGNYAVFQYILSGSGLPFIRLRWAYQPDGTPNFNGQDAVSSGRFRQAGNEQDFRISGKNGSIFIAWNPRPGNARFRIVDLRGEILMTWTCDAQEGNTAKKIGHLQETNMIYLIQASLGNKILTTRLPRIN